MEAVETYLKRAVELAQLGRGHTRPNPPVGAVVVRNGAIIGEGYHHRCGEPHAEVMALTNARERGNEPRGADLYVTLEPCSHAGRVGACTDAITAAGIRHVVFAVSDPNPRNADGAIATLAKAGITCEQAPQAMAQRVGALDLIAPFAKFMTQKLPFVTVKIAMSLDGKICDDFGSARWISSAAARQKTGEYREWVDAILVGAETVRADNPSLLSHGKPNPDLIRVVATRSGNVPKTAQIFTDGQNSTEVYTNPPSLRALLSDLAERHHVMHVLCEGGLKLATALAKEGLVDEWVTVLAPKVIGADPLSQAVEIPQLRVIVDTPEV